MSGHRDQAAASPRCDQPPVPRPEDRPRPKASAATPRVCAAKDSHKLSFANDDFKIDLRVETCTENQWARIVRSVMGEISRPDSMLVLPVPLSEKEAERVKNEWLRKVKV